jgi:leucyl aminopeptidase
LQIKLGKENKTQKSIKTMINIDKYAEIKQDISLLIICNTKNLEVSLRNNFNSDESSYILSNYEQNKKKFFAFNHLNRFVLVSIVEEKDDSNATMEMYRRVGGKVLRECDKNFIKDLQLYTLADKDNVLAFVEGMLESSYIFDKYKTDPTRLIHPFDNLHIIGTEVDEKDITQKRIIFSACEKAKDLVNEPVEVINATNLSKYFTELSKQASIEIDVWNKAKIEKEKMGGILAVNRGSVDEPTFTIMTYKPQNATNQQPIVLVGKGITYDTGGLNIKPGDYMNDMKSDMAGAATMACAIYSIAMQKLPLYVIGLFPATDNRPNNNAYCSGDIINMYDGTNVEVVNTDAEGRMILADALAYAKQLNPMLVIDMATLTGAASRAIGPFGIAAIEKDAKAYMQTLKEVGESVYERIAEFPFWSEYDDLIVSDIADIKNSGENYAGMITAGKFLAYFTAYPYIHLDIAGVAMIEKQTDYRDKGASAYGLRLIDAFLKQFCK